MPSCPSDDVVAKAWRPDLVSLGLALLFSQSRSQRHDHAGLIDLSGSLSTPFGKSAHGPTESRGLVVRSRATSLSLVTALVSDGQTTDKLTSVYWNLVDWVPDSNGETGLSENRRDKSGTVIGLVTFLFGVGLIVATFAYARDLFSVDPGKAMNVKPGETLDINSVVSSFMGVVVKILLLIVMSAIGSVVASRGIKLYVQAGNFITKKEIGQ